METTICKGSYIGTMEKKMETTVSSWGLYRDHGKEHGNCHIVYGGFRFLSIWLVRYEAWPLPLTQRLLPES